MINVIVAPDKPETLGKAAIFRPPTQLAKIPPVPKNSINTVAITKLGTTNGITNKTVIKSLKGNLHLTVTHANKTPIKVDKKVTKKTSTSVLERIVAVRTLNTNSQVSAKLSG